MKQNLKSIIKRISELRDKMKEFVEGLPETNSGVKLLSDSPRCAVVSFSTIAANKGILCPHYYLNATAKEELLKILETTKVERLEERVSQIIQTGKLWDGAPPHLTLHPDFIEALKKIWEI